MQIQHQDNGTQGIFYGELNGQQVAELTYVWRGTDHIIIDHTQVSNALKGKGVGKELVVNAVEFARAKGIKIVPACSFARRVLEEGSEYRDVAA
jgi:uncharacterized protein